MNALQKKLISALPEHLQDEHAINTIARLNNTTFGDAVSVVWLRFAEQQEKIKIRITFLTILSVLIKVQPFNSLKLMHSPQKKRNAL